MARSLSVGAIVGITFGVLGLLFLLCGVALLKRVLTHRRRVRQAVREASRGGGGGTTGGRNARRSRYPAALPCENYYDLFGDEEPAIGNAVFKNREELAHLRDMFVRVEEADDGQSSREYSTTELVSLSPSFDGGPGFSKVGYAPDGKASAHAMATTLPVSHGTSSFDNLHNVVVNVISTFPTPASSMPSVFGTRYRGEGRSMPSSYQPRVPEVSTGVTAVSSVLNCGEAFSQPVSRTAEVSAKDGLGSGGRRLLVPIQECGVLSEGAGKGGLPASSGRCKEQGLPYGSPQSLSCVADPRDLNAPHLEDGTPSGSGIPTPCKRREDPWATSPVVRPTSMMLTDGDADASLRPRATTTEVENHDALPLAVASATEGYLNTMHTADRTASLVEHSGRCPLLRTRHVSIDSFSPSAPKRKLSHMLARHAGGEHHDRSHPHATAPHAKKHKLRIHRRHRVRNIDKGGYVVLEESASSDADDVNAAAASPATSTAARESPQATAEEVGGAAEPDSTTAPDSTASPVPKDIRKKRYYFEMLPSLDVYGRSQYLPREQTTDETLDAGGAMVVDGGDTMDSVGPSLLSRTRCRTPSMDWPHDDAVQ